MTYSIETVKLLYIFYLIEYVSCEMQYLDNLYVSRKPYIHLVCFGGHYRRLLQKWNWYFAVAVYNDHRNTLNVYMVSVRHKDCLNTASRMTHIRRVKKCKVIFKFWIPYVRFDLVVLESLFFLLYNLQRQNNIFEAGSSMFNTFSITRSTFQNTSTLMFRQGHL